MKITINEQYYLLKRQWLFDRHVNIDVILIHLNNCVTIKKSLWNKDLDYILKLEFELLCAVKVSLEYYENIWFGKYIHGKLFLLIKKVENIADGILLQQYYKQISTEKNCWVKKGILWDIYLF